MRPARMDKDKYSWQVRKQRKKDKHVPEEFKPKSNNAPKGGKPKAWEARKPPKDKDTCFGCGEKGYMKKDCSKTMSASTPSKRLKSLLGGGLSLKRVYKLGVETLVRDSCFSKVKIMTNTFLCWLTQGQTTRS